MPLPGTGGKLKKMQEIFSVLRNRLSKFQGLVHATYMPVLTTCKINISDQTQ